MANYTALKQSIRQIVKSNHANEIDGPDLQGVLISMVNSLGADFQFAGIATLNTNPGTPDQKVAYLAVQAGYYANFGLRVASGEIAFLVYNTSWTKVSCPTPANSTQAAIMAAGKYFNFSYQFGNATSGLLRYTDGEPFSPTGNYQYSDDYMPVFPGQTLKTNAIGTVTAAALVFYDANRVFLSAEHSTGSLTTVTVPSGAYFVRLSSESGISNTYLDNVAGDVPDFVADLQNSVFDIWRILTEQISFDYQIGRNLKPGLFRAGTGAIFEQHLPYQYCEDYFPVFPGQKLISSLYAVGSAIGIVWYDENKNYVGGVECFNNPNIFVIVPDGVQYMRVCAESNLAQRYVRNIPDIDTSAVNGQVFFDNNQSEYIIDAESGEFTPDTPEIQHPYSGQVTPEKRYIAFGFDDFRASDFSWVIPLFNKYGFHATFNRINRDARTQVNQKQLWNVINSRHEIGEHSIMHEQYVWLSPLFNGQNPSSPDGSQVPFPSNNDLRQSRGDGKNVFGKTITENVSFDGAQSTWPVVGVAWANLTDAQCQAIRDCYSVIRDEEYGLLLDNLSNEFLGTSGRSAGSWNGSQYTGGIFTGCKTSANHEIWERICLIEQRYYLKVFNLNWRFRTWSLPGAKNSKLYFESSGKYYFDRAMTQFANCLASFTSTLYANKLRSWVDVLREFGYNNVHDSDYPSRNDGNSLPQMARNLTINASFSKRDALIYPTLRTVKWWGYGSFIRSFFGTSKEYAKLMYNAQFNGSRDTNGFFQSIEDVRRFTSQGIITGCVWDSNDLFEEKVYLEGVLQYCKATGVEVITKQEAMEIAMRRQVLAGNLIYNPRLRNTAKEFLPDADVPTNPDGYEGNCSVSVIDNVPILIASGATYYKHYGIPTGRKLRYRAEIKGNGVIGLYKLRNKSGFYNSEDVSITSRQISNADFAEVTIDFTIADAALETWNGITEDLGEKVCAMSIKYPAGFQVRNISLQIV